MTARPAPFAPAIISLRDYQKGVVREVSDHYQSGLKAVLLQMPTGAGKTRTAAYIVRVYAKTNRQVLWLVHREELLLQAAMTFAEYGIPHRLVCAASSERAIKVQEHKEFGRSLVDNTSTVVVASIQTIVRRLDSLSWLQPEQIVADECHLSLAATWRKVLAKWADARLLGLTATPWRLDKQSFARADGGLYDAIVLGPQPADLIDWGNLADYRLFQPPVQFSLLDKIGMKGGDYDTKELEKEFSNVVYGDVVGHYRKYSHGKPAIAFCPTVKIAEETAQAFREAGYRAICLDGNTDDIIRRTSLQQLGRGELDVVTSVSILVEGTDVPFATTAILLRKTQSLSLYLQAVGRVLRAHPDKPFAIILDCVGVSDMHGWPDDYREWALNGTVKRRKKRNAANDDGPDELIRECPECYAKHEPKPKCPVCGHVYTAKERPRPKVIDADLVEADRRARREEQERIRQEQMAKQRQEQAQADTVEELMARLGYSRGRAEAVVKAREEKAGLQDALRQAIKGWHDRHKGSIKATFGIYTSDIGKLKPKELRQLLQDVANDDRARRLAAGEVLPPQPVPEETAGDMFVVEEVA